LKISDIIDELSIEVLAGNENLNKEITGGYCSDLLSIVMSSAREGQVWITMQGHPNIVAISVLINLAAIIVSENSKVDDETLEKAREENAVILRSELTSYEIAGRLYKLGVTGELNA